MAEYIEREALIKKTIEEKRFVFRWEDMLNHEYVFQTVYKDLADFIFSVPAADVVEVVRCKDCKYFNQKVSCGGFCKCGEVNGGRPHMRVNDDFCSYGERKAE